MILTCLTLIGGYYSYLSMEYWVHRLSHQKWSGYIYRLHMDHHLNSYPPQKTIDDPPYKITDKHYLLTKGTIGYALPVSSIVISIYYFVPDYYNYLLILEFIGLLLMSNHLHEQYHIKGSYLEDYTWFLRNRKYHETHHRSFRYNFMLGGFDATMDYLGKTFKHES